MPDASGPPIPNPVTALRLALLANGYEPLPCAGKRPVLDGWQALPITPDRIAAWARIRRADNTGIRTGFVRAVDVDVLDAELAEHLAAVAERTLGANPLRRIGQPPKLLIPYRTAEPGRKLLTAEYRLPDGSRAQVEVLGARNQFIGYGVHPDTGREYEWHGGGLDVVRLADLPLATPDAIAAFISQADAILAAAAPLSGGRRKGAQAATASAAPSPPPASVTAIGAPPAGGWPPPTRETVEDALRHVPNTHDWHGWFRIGAAIWDALGDDGFDLFAAWSAQSTKNNPAETRRKWQSFRTSPPEVKAATLFFEARQNGWTPPRPARPRRQAEARPVHAAPPGAPPGRAEATAATPDVELSEDGVARLFEAQNAGLLRHVDEAGHWLRWTGAYWAPAPRGLAFTFARDLVRRVNRGAPDKAKITTGRAAFAGGVETFAKRGPLSIQAADLDRDPWLLATPGGTVDLRTGTLRPADPHDYCTRSTAVAPAGPGTPAPAWHRFLADATGNDAELAAFLQRWAGYCLTGDTREHALLFVYGPGGNGKTVFANTLSGIAGSYATVAPMDTFTAQHGDRHPTDLAMLRGARLVTASETEEGRAWAESRIKQMTGGEPITARFMRMDFFTFTPAFKLMLIGNHKPVLRNVDEAARRRFRIVPFLTTPAVPDLQLADRLRAEWPAILRWMIDGCLAWQRHGLGQPDAVKTATDEYFEAQDAFGAWAADRCIFDHQLQERPSRLLADFNEWADVNGERPTNRNRLRGWIERQAGLRYKRLKGADYVAGIGLRPAGVGRRGGADD